jgi:bacteriorhodopsin
MNAPQTRAQFLRSIEHVDALNLAAQEAQARAEAARPEPLWVSIALVLGVGLVFVSLIIARAWLG